MAFRHTYSTGNDIKGMLHNLHLNLLEMKEDQKKNTCMKV